MRFIARQNYKTDILLKNILFLHIYWFCLALSLYTSARNQQFAFMGRFFCSIFDGTDRLQQSFHAEPVGKTDKLFFVQFMFSVCFRESAYFNLRLELFGISEQLKSADISFHMLSSFLALQIISLCSVEIIISG